MTNLACPLSNSTRHITTGLVASDILHNFISYFVHPTLGTRVQKALSRGLKQSTPYHACNLCKLWLSYRKLWPKPWAWKKLGLQAISLYLWLCPGEALSASCQNDQICALKEKQLCESMFVRKAASIPSTYKLYLELCGNTTCSHCSKKFHLEHSEAAGM